VIVRLRRRGLLGSGDFGAQALQFLVERGLVGQQRCKAFVLRVQLLLQCLQLFGGLRRNLRWMRQRRGIERQSGIGTFDASVGPRQPVTDVEQFAYRRDGIGLRHGTVALHRPVSQHHDHTRLVEDRLASGLLESGFVDQCGKIVLIRQPQRWVVLVRPVHRQFQRTARVETRRAWIGAHHTFHLRRGTEDSRPFTLEESELGHAATFQRVDGSSSLVTFEAIFIP